MAFDRELETATHGQEPANGQLTTVGSWAVLLLRLHCCTGDFRAMRSRPPVETRLQSAPPKASYLREDILSEESSTRFLNDVAKTYLSSSPLTCWRCSIEPHSSANIWYRTASSSVGGRSCRKGSCEGSVAKKSSKLGPGLSDELSNQSLSSESIAEARSSPATSRVCAFAATKQRLVCGGGGGCISEAPPHSAQAAPTRLSKVCRVLPLVTMQKSNRNVLPHTLHRSNNIV